MTGVRRCRGCGDRLVDQLDWRRWYCTDACRSRSKNRRHRQDRPPRRADRQAFRAVAAGAWRADCMTDEEWTEWVAMNPVALSDGQVADRPCTDCPLGFAAEMRALGRCNGTPGPVLDDPDPDPVPA
jgi:hypothetical protein